MVRVRPFPLPATAETGAVGPPGAIAAPVLVAVLAQARAAAPHEACGLLLAAPGAEIGALLPFANIAREPTRRFRLDPAALLASVRVQREAGMPVVGVYHSHPQGAPVPSAEDAAHAGMAGWLWLIVTPAGAHACYRAQAGGPLHGAFVAWPLDVVGARPEGGRHGDG